MYILFIKTAEPSISPKEAPGYAPIERTHIRPDSSSPVSDFSHAGFVRSTRPHRIPRRSRSVSDSIVPSSAFSPDHHVSPVRPKRFILHRANSLATIPAYHGSDSNDLASDSGESSPPLRPSVTMDVQTYLVYERLQRQHTALRKLYSELQKMASLYEHRAAQLRATYIRRAAEFEQIERAARHAIEEQEDTERRLKEVEDGSAKLHYELNVLNDHLKDVEDNVSTFYGKVGLLEQKMQDSQQSITTMLIIGNYFNYYWQKMKRWVGYYDWCKHERKVIINNLIATHAFRFTLVCAGLFALFLLVWSFILPSPLVDNFLYTLAWMRFPFVWCKGRRCSTWRIEEGCNIRLLPYGLWQIYHISTWTLRTISVKETAHLSLVHFTNNWYKHFISFLLRPRKWFHQEQAKRIQLRRAPLKLLWRGIDHRMIICLHNKRIRKFVRKFEMFMLLSLKVTINKIKR